MLFNSNSSKLLFELRQLSLVPIAVFISILLFTGCDKDTETATAITASTDYPESAQLRSSSSGIDTTKCDSILNAVTKTSGKLVFSDELHFTACKACLQRNHDNYHDAYLALYPNATTLQLDSLDSVNNFNPWLKFEEFELSLNFDSHRKDIEDQIIAYENTPYELQDIDEYPEFNSPVVDEATRTLFNEDGEATVGGVTVSMEGDFLWDACGFLRYWGRSWGPSDDVGLTGGREIVTNIGVVSGVITSTLKSGATFLKYGKRKRANMRITQVGRPHKDISMNGDFIWDECGFLTTNREVWTVSDDFGLSGNRQLITSISVVSGVITSTLKSNSTFRRKGKRKRANMKIIQTGKPHKDCVLQHENEWDGAVGFKKRKSMTLRKRIWWKWREAYVNSGDSRWDNDKCYFDLAWVRPNGGGVALFTTDLKR